GDLVDRVAIVVRGVVDENVERAVRLDVATDRFLQAGNVGEVDALEARLAAEARDQSQRIRLGNVEEGHIGALAHEAVGQTRADARAAAGDQDALALEARIDRPAVLRLGRLHGISFRHESGDSVHETYFQLRTDGPHSRVRGPCPRLFV